MVFGTLANYFWCGAKNNAKLFCTLDNFFVSLHQNLIITTANVVKILLPCK